MRDRHPNILLVVMDTARRDAFTPYGAPPDATPAVAQLARRGVAFEHAVAASNWTMPSHVSLLTGLLPRTAGLSCPPGNKQSAIAAVFARHRDRYLPAVLRRAGYRTRGISANVWISRATGFAHGFDEFVEVMDRRVRLMHDARPLRRLLWYLQALEARLDDGLATVERHIARWIAEPDGRPWFWFANLIECHSPYLPPRPYNDFGPLRRLLAAHDARVYQTMHGVWWHCISDNLPPRRALWRMRHLYDRSVRMMDAWLGRILERLDAAHLLDETLVIVTSDHGENFGEGGLVGHAVSLDERLIAVPVIVAGPGAASVEGIWSQARLPAYVARAADLEDPPWQPTDLPAGAAVAQYDTGMTPDLPDIVRFRRAGATPEGLRRFLEPGTCATDGRYKLVMLGDREHLYDLERDPLEESPLDTPCAPPASMARLRRAIDEAARTAWTPAPPDSPSVPADPALEERLRLLGYM